MNAIEYAQKATELYTVPDTANQLRRLFERDDSHMSDIAQVVSADPGLAVHLLKYANSPIFRFERKIESLEKAIQVIGVKSVYEFALVFGITNMITRDHQKYIDLNKFWQQSILCGLYGMYFARKVKERDVSRMYTSGLLHNVGELAVLRVSPAVARDCNRLSPKGLPKQCQEEVLGFSYAEVSAALLQRWLIPDALVSTVAMQHHDEAPAVTVESQIAQLAYNLAVIETHKDYYNVDEHLPEFLYTSLQLDKDILHEAIENNRDEYESLSAIFKMHG
ncbi:MAG: HDOD domain-containing protein [Glaciecola sp.]